VALSSSNKCLYKANRKPAECMTLAIALHQVLSSQSVVAQAEHTERKESETYDIYLLPPNEDPETCQSWLRMRNRDGRYNLMFEEWVCDGPFIISPRITFEVCSQLAACQRVRV